MKSFDKVYRTASNMVYNQGEVWFPLAESVADWGDDFHALMLNDQLRMRAYEKAIHEVVRPGMEVLDIGTGTGILAKWALDAGADFVYGVEANSERIPQAQARLDRAGYKGQYCIINKYSYDVSLPQRVDLILSEILGNLGDNENMTAILNHARRKFLKPDGIMLPAQVQTLVAPITSEFAHQQVKSLQISAINPRYNIRDLLNSRRIQSPFDISYDCIFSDSSCLAATQIIKKFYFEGADQGSYHKNLSFQIAKDGLFTGFKGAFIAQLSKQTALDITADDIVNRKTSDCWKHCYLPVEIPFWIKVGDRLNLTFQCNSWQTQQVYTWKGNVYRGGQCVYRFNQSMRPKQGS